MGEGLRKPISIAMTISAGVHTALILLVAWKIDATRLPIPQHQDIIVSLEGRDDEGRSSSLSSEEPIVAAPEPTPPALPDSHDLPTEVTAVPTASLADISAEPDAADTRDAAPETMTDAAPEPAEAPDTAPIPAAAPNGASERGATPSPEPSAATVATVTTAVPTETAVQAFDRRQRSMLDKKIRKWTETYHKRRQPDEEMSWRHDGQHYTARFAELPADVDTALDRVVVEVSTEVDGELLTTQMQMKRLAFSNYAQFVNRWDENVQIHDDELDGRFHANSEINLAYSRDTKPQFLGKVTTSARTINITQRRGRTRRDEVFLGGLQTGVRSIRLPKNFVPLPESATLRDDQIQEFDDDTRITFHADGSYTWISFADGLFERRGHIRAPASYLIAKNKAKLHVRGTVSGKVLVYSPERIVIAGDLLYATDPETDRNNDDFIGLVSAKNIEVAGPKITGPGDLKITAAIYAKRRFSIDDYRDKNGGLLEIYGSLTAGSLSATEPRFATKIRFDPRLESARPPGFPVTDRYEVESWDAAWTVEADSAQSL